MKTPNDSRTLTMHREVVFLSLALWGVAATGCQNTRNDQCVPADAPDREACLEEGCIVNDDEWSPEFHFCMEVDDPSACGACEEDSECVMAAEEKFAEVSEDGLGGAWVGSTVCGPAEGETSCCYTVRLERGAIGRAFSTMKDSMRVAPTVGGGEVPAGAEGYLSEYWRRAAEIEHASVASFARFTLQLMSLGAPPSLLAQAHQAGLDEIEHARLAYGLAQRFGGGSMSAGRLSLAGALDQQLLEDPQAIVLATLREGCVGETLAAAWAALAAKRCKDAETKAILEQIAQDELRHAALAWETLAWARSVFPEQTRAALREWKHELEPFAEDPTGMPEWGVLGSEDEMAITERVMASTIRPAIDALLA